MSAADSTRLELSGAILFVPATERVLAKLGTIDADAIVVDLEDAIHPEAKDEARELAVAAIGALDPREQPVLARVNPLELGGGEDLDALTAVEVDGLLLPKISDRESLAAYAERVAASWGERPAPRLVPMIESAGGLVEIAAILGAGRELPPALWGVALGAEDFAADMGVVRSDSGAEVQLARQLIAVHARASEVVAIDTPFIDTADERRLTRDAREAAALGFTAKLCIHPKQVPVVRAALAPTPTQLAWARRILAAAELQSREGRGVGSVEGQMLDSPVILQAERILVRGSRK